MDLPISQLPPASGIQDSDLFPIVQFSGYATDKVTALEMANYFNSKASLGAEFSFLQSTPQNNFGNNNDVAWNTLTGQILQKQNGNWGVQYTIPTPIGSINGITPNNGVFTLTTDDIPQGANNKYLNGTDLSPLISNSVKAQAILNQTSPQTGASFYIDGTGTFALTSDDISNMPVPVRILSAYTNANATNTAPVNAIFRTNQTVSNPGTIQGVEGYVKLSHTSGVVNAGGSVYGTIEVSGAGGTTNFTKSFQSEMLLSNGTVNQHAGFVAVAPAVSGSGSIGQLDAFFAYSGAGGVRVSDPSYFGQITSTKIIVSGHDSSYFLKADGSLDNNPYITLNSPLTGFSSLSGTISATDTTITAIGKLYNLINGLSGGIVYQGVWNASTNSPALTSGTGTKGYLYKVSVAGSTTLDGVNSWNVGDEVYFDGTTWDKIDGIASEVISFNGRTGALSLIGTDITSALGFTPYDSSNPAGYITSSALSPYVTSSTLTTTLAGYQTTIPANTFAPYSNSANYIQNNGTGTPQTGSLNITGSGTFGSSLNVTGNANLNSGATVKNGNLTLIGNTADFSQGLELLVPAFATNPNISVNGQIGYNTTTNLFQFFQNGGWVGLGSGSSGLSLSSPLTGLPSNSSLNLTASTTILNGFAQLQNQAIYNASKIVLGGVTSMLSFGDSYTTGYLASTPTTKGYIYQFAGQTGLSLTNWAVSGTGGYQAGVNANRYIPVNNTNLITSLFGFNDVRYGGSSTGTIGTVLGGLSSLLASAFLGSITPASALTTGAGSWTALTVGAIGDKAGYNGGTGIYATSSTSTKTYSFTGPTLVIGTWNTDGTAQKCGSFSWSIDSGAITGSYNGNGQANGIQDGASNTTTRQPYAVVLRNLGAGSHTVTITASGGSSTNPVYLDYIGTLRIPNVCPPVIVGLIPYMTPTGYAISPSNGSTASASVLNNAKVNYIRNTFFGYPVGIVDVNKYQDPNVQGNINTDNIHLTDTGQGNISQGYQSVISPFLSSGIFNSTAQQTANFNISGNGGMGTLTVGVGTPYATTGVNIWAQFGSAYPVFILDDNSTGSAKGISFNAYQPTTSTRAVVTAGYMGLFQFDATTGNLGWYSSSASQTVGANPSLVNPITFLPTGVNITGSITQTGIANGCSFQNITNKGSVTLTPGLVTVTTGILNASNFSGGTFFVFNPSASGSYTIPSATTNAGAIFILTRAMSNTQTITIGTTGATNTIQNYSGTLTNSVTLANIGTAGSSLIYASDGTNWLLIGSR